MLHLPVYGTIWTMAGSTCASAQNRRRLGDAIPNIDVLNDLLHDWSV